MNLTNIEYSIVLNGRKTSVSLENEFWTVYARSPTPKCPHCRDWCSKSTKVGMAAICPRPSAYSCLNTCAGKSPDHRQADEFHPNRQWTNDDHNVIDGD
jgi:hypothetical protein